MKCSRCKRDGVFICTKPDCPREAKAIDGDDRAISAPPGYVVAECRRCRGKGWVFSTTNYPDSTAACDGCKGAGIHLLPLPQKGHAPPNDSLVGIGEGCALEVRQVQNPHTPAVMPHG